VIEYVGLHTRLLPGQVETYETAHRSVWPELLVAQRDVGITRWLIFRRDLDLFHAVECHDWDQAAARLTAQPIDQQWQREMAKYTEVDPGETAPASDRLKLVYHGQPQILLG
jgi:L-rhamnose mutarotase